FDAGRYGRKTQIGNYRYDTKGKAIDPPSPDHETDATPAEAVYVAAGAEVFDDLFAGAKILASDDGASPIVAALFGEDCSTFAAREGIDHRRLVAIDVTGDISGRMTIMTAPGADPAARDAVAASLAKAGRKVTAIKDSPGFIGQRMRGMIGNLGCEMAQIDIADPASIDLAMRLGLNYPMGPLEIIDDLGCDVAWRIMTNIQDITGDPRYRPSLWLRRRAQLGLSAVTPN
ncbi:MAG: 3-hydroxybutyryl-CoA dehydrogenase, partial [Rhodospirillaceae bacterium]|nr:3-hydroxybutyryl-CoA dehydrogenase [Rhodospirillaceae bacterium]